MDRIGPKWIEYMDQIDGSATLIWLNNGVVIINITFQFLNINI